MRDDAAKNEPSWEPIDRRRMAGVFDAIGYSSDPIAMFRTERDANEWLAWDASRGDDQTVCCETCVIPVDVGGRCWNSIEPCTVPEPLELPISDYECTRCGEAAGLRRDIEAAHAQRSAAAEALRRLEQIITRTGGYMEHDDQASLFAARALLAEIGR